MYDIKYNLPIIKKDEWEKESDFGLMFVPYNYKKVEVFWLENTKKHSYYINNRKEGIETEYQQNLSKWNLNKPYGYYREIKYE